MLNSHAAAHAQVDDGANAVIMLTDAGKVVIEELIRCVLKLWGSSSGKYDRRLSRFQSGRRELKRRRIRIRIRVDDEVRCPCRQRRDCCQQRSRVTSLHVSLSWIGDGYCGAT